VVQREVARLGMSTSEGDVAKLLKYETVEPFLAAVGYGDVSTTTIANRLAAVQEPERPLMVSTPTTTTGPSSTTGIRVMGVGDLLSRLATCRHPVPGDDIVGFITRTRGVTVHRADCTNVGNIEDRERLVRVDWGDEGRRYAVPVQINADDRLGLLRDIASVVSSEGINIIQTYQRAMPDGTAQFMMTMETTGMGQLSKVLARIESVPGVTSAARSATPPPA
jgi:GTP pyrophosphokinase